ncbi:hypothetical protein G3A43_06735 [Paraburkholderia aspalathi]|nr:type-F conjugative transfer system secretin TraK [Paraburkholderia aspalathi]MBK3779946.1 hypothetical protein [Paraburkholderia aspalathi]
MRTTPTRLSLAVLALLVSAGAYAQSAAPVVPPPTPPGQAPQVIAVNQNAAALSAYAARQKQFIQTAQGAHVTGPAAANNIAPQPAPAPATATSTAAAARAAYGPVAGASATQAGASSAARAAAGVMPAEPVSSFQPVAVAPASAPNLMDISLPAKPTPDAAPGELKPSAPFAQGTKKVAAKKHALRSLAKLEKEKEAPVAQPNPFEGLDVRPVSDSQLNRFVFPEPVEDVFFAEGAPLPDCPANAGAMDPCKPVFLNGRRMMLLQLRAGAKGPVQMLTHLYSGRIVTTYLMPAAGPGAVVRIDNAEDGPSDARIAKEKRDATTTAAAVDTTMSDSEQNVQLLSRFAKGDIPAGYEPEAVGAPVRYQLFDVIPLASWTDGANWRVHLVQVKAFGSQPVAINAGLFRNQNVRAVALDRETITDKAPAQLYMLEYLPSEQQ